MNPTIQKMKEILSAAKTDLMQVQIPPGDPDTLLIQGVLASLLANLEKELK